MCVMTTPIRKPSLKPSNIDPVFPIEDARAWSRPFFQWYNEEHYHTGLGLLTPATVHYEHHQPVHDQRQRVLDAAYAAQPERFVRGRPTVQPLPEAVWINPPKEASVSTEKSSLNSPTEVSKSP